MWIDLRIFFIIFNFINCDTLTFGKEFYWKPRLWTQELFKSNSLIPKNYTIIYKLTGFQRYSPAYSYVELRVDNNTSNGTLEVDSEYRSINVTVNVINGINFTVILEAYGFGFPLSDLSYQNKRSRGRPRSITIVHVQSDIRTRFRRNGIGRRQPGDQLIYFKSYNVTNSSKFAVKEFEYRGNDKKAITFVGFSFDSSTAVAYLNSTFIGKYDISAIVYDLTAPHFEANMTIYGYESEYPGNFEPILSLANGRDQSLK